jgi:hypothetical protein
MAVPSLSSVEWVGLTPATVREVSAPVSPQLDAASVDRYFAGREQRAESREPSLAWGAASGAETVADWVWEDHELWQLASDVDEVSQVAGIDELFAR